MQACLKVEPILTEVAAAAAAADAETAARAKVRWDAALQHLVGYPRLKSSTLPLANADDYECISNCYMVLHTALPTPARDA